MARQRTRNDFKAMDEIPTTQTYRDLPAVKNGKDRQGYQRWRCRRCGKCWSENPAPKRPGRPAIGDFPMTLAERQQRWRQKKLQNPLDDTLNFVT